MKTIDRKYDRLEQKVSRTLTSHKIATHKKKSKLEQRIEELEK